MSIVEQQLNLDTANVQLNFGWEEVLTKQLVENSRQPHIEEMTEDPELLFSSETKVEEWLAERFSTDDPMIAWLGGAAGDLAGLAWIQNAHLRRNKGQRLFGVRVYEGYLGQGHGTRLTKAIHERFDTERPGAVSRFTMRKQNNAGFVLGAIAGYKLIEQGNIDTQTYVRNSK